MKMFQLFQATVDIDKAITELHAKLARTEHLTQGLSDFEDQLTVCRKELQLLYTDIAVLMQTMGLLGHSIRQAYGKASKTPGPESVPQSEIYQPDQEPEPPVTGLGRARN